MRLRLKILSYILAIVLFYALYYWAIPAVINIEKNCPIIEDIVEKKSGYKIDIKNPHIKMGLGASIWFRADSFRILNDDNSDALNFKKPVLKVDILPFIIGKCHVKYLSADSLYLNLALDKDLRLYLGQYILVENSKSILDINHIKLNIQDYLIKMTDKSFNKNIIVKGDYITIDKFIKEKLLEMSTAALIDVDGNKSVLNFDLNVKLPITKNLSNNNVGFTGSITNLNLSYLSKYISYFTDKKIWDVKGILNLESRSENLSNKHNHYILNFTFEKFGLNGKNFVKPYYFPDKLEFHADSSAIKRDFIVNKLTIKSKKLNMLLAGSINKITTNSPELDLNFEMPNTRAEEIVALLIGNNKLYKGLGFDIETLVKTGFYADVNSKLNIHGKLEAPEVYGDLKITNAYVTPHPISNGAAKATINLTFDKDKLLMDVFVPAAKTQYVTVKGYTQTLGEKLSDFTIKSTTSVDLALAQRILDPVHKVLDFELGPVPIMDIKGFGNIDLRIVGNKANPSAFGSFNFSNGTVSFIDVHYMTVKNASGTLKFDNKNTVFNLRTGFLNNKPISIDGTCSLSGELNFKAATKKQKVDDLLKILKHSPMLKDISPYVSPVNTKSGLADFNLNLTGKVKNVNDIILGKTIFAVGEVSLYDVTAFLDKINLPMNRISGKIKFNNMNLDVNLESIINKSKIKIKGTMKDNFADMSVNSENLTPQDLLMYIGNSKFHIARKDALKNNGFIVFNSNYKGPVNKIDLKKLTVNGNANINDFKFYYLPKKIPVEIVSGNITIKNDNVYFSNINGKLASMPMFVKGKISNIYEEPIYNLYLNCKPNQSFSDILINRSEIYPLKLKGDINSTTYLKGTPKELKVISDVKLLPNARIYYMGSTIGDEIHPINLALDVNINKNKFYINNFSIDKLITSLDNRLYPTRELTFSGGVTYLKNDIVFDNFKVKTFEPTDSKIFNIIFKKPFIKQGTFTSDVKINGSILNPSVLGNFSVFDINIPNYFLNFDNVNLAFKNRNIDVNAKGQFFDKNFKINGILENRLKQPYRVEQMDVFVSEIDLNEIHNAKKNVEMESSKLLQKESKNIDLSSFLIKNSVFRTDTIMIDNTLLHDFYANLILNKENMEINNFRFKTAQGKIHGDYKYGLKNHIHSVQLKLSNINSAVFTETLFEMKNQISGDFNGTMEFSCKGNNQEKCLSTLKGIGGFEIENGKMPKLGSLEYLLNAANLVKSGVTGLSINSLVDLITPLRTGEFESIKGSFAVRNGLCDNIQIFSAGKNLNLFITGEYNLSTQIAQMSLFGRLAKNTANVLGPIGSASLNALFNTIPGIRLSAIENNYLLDSINKIPGVEISSKKYRIFTVDINGDINSDNYVKSFKWVE